MKDVPVIKGQYLTGRVWVNGKEITPERSLAVLDHSPDGFNWGYAGSGPAQLALAILLELLHGDEQTALDWHQDFKSGFVMRLPREADFETGIPQVWAIRIIRHNVGRRN